MTASLKGLDLCAVCPPGMHRGALIVLPRRPACGQIWLTMETAIQLDAVFNRLLASGAEMAQTTEKRPQPPDQSKLADQPASTPDRRSGGGDLVPTGVTFGILVASGDLVFLGGHARARTGDLYGVNVAL